MRIAVLGTGAIGAPIGALLTRAGHDVVLVDQWPAHVEAMRREGLRLTVGDRARPELDERIAVRAHHLFEVCTFREPLDLVFLACKSYDTRWMVQLIEPRLADDGVVVSVQNSLNDEWIAPIVGEARDVGCVLTGGGELLGPAHVWRNRGLSHHYYTLGELDGRETPRLQGIAGILSDAGKVTTTTNYWGAKWSKLVSNCTSAALSALVDAGLRSWELIEDPPYRRASAALYREGASVAMALGQKLEPLFGMSAEELSRAPEEVMTRLISAKSGGASEGATNMVQQDLRKGRPTEVVGYFNGLMVRKGRRAGVATPANEAVTALYARLERGLIRQDRAHLASVLAAVDEAAPARSG